MGCEKSSDLDRAGEMQRAFAIRPVCPVDNDKRHNRFATSLDLSPALVPAYTTRMLSSIS